MFKAILFVNGEIENIESVKSSIKGNELIIGVDGGCKYCRILGIKPDIALGDFDSISSEDYAFICSPDTEKLSFPPEKDYIDLILGIETAIDRGCDEIIVWGAFGGPRGDMYFANISCIGNYNAKIILKNEYNTVTCLKGGNDYIIKSDDKKYLSLIPLSETVTFRSSSGLKYPLDGITLGIGETRGLSNELTRAEATIDIIYGKILCFQSGK